MTEDLKSCPFCGSSPALIGKKNEASSNAAYIECDKCGAKSKTIKSSVGWSDAIGYAIEAWNRRMP